MMPVDFGALLEAIPDAVVVADMRARIVYANAAVEHLLGWRSEDLIGRSLHVIQPRRMHAPHDAGFRRYAETGERTIMGTPVRLPAKRADGSEIDIELNLAEITGADGQRLVVAVLRDLAERVELERHLAVMRYLRATSAAAARLWTRLDPHFVLQTLTDVLVVDFDAALARTWIHEPEANRLRMATSGGLSTRTVGSSRELIDLATYPYKVGVVAREQRPFVRNGLAGDAQFDQDWVAREGLQSVACLPLLAGDQLLGVMVAFFRHRLPDEVVETIGHLAALASAALNDSHLVELERDARSAADDARRRSELLASVSDRLSASLDPDVTVGSVTDALVPQFADWCILDLVSERGGLAMVATAHVDPDGVAHIRELRDRFPPRADSKPPHAIYRAIRGGAAILETISTEDLAARAESAEHLGLLTRLGIGSHVVLPLSARGHVVGALSLVRDPGRSPFDANELQTAEDIGRRVALAIDNAQLYRSSVDAVAMREQFLAVASHELRTPLSVVRGNWELLGRHLKDAAATEGRESLAQQSFLRLGEGLNQLQRLVEDLLDIDRLRSGGSQLRPSRQDLVEVLTSAVDELPDADARGRVRLAAGRGPVHGEWDRERLLQVLRNLITNALKYSPADGEVNVSLVTRSGRAVISVADAGIGIPPDQLDAVFQPFTRGTNAMQRHYAGFGLGLAVSREIITQHGGRIWAESSGDNQGSTIRVELPL